MTSICYYNTQIKEELDGAKEYIEKAICCKQDHPDWAKLYAEMSEAELNHAKSLVMIFEDDYKKTVDTLETVDPIYPQFKEELLKMYTEFTGNIKCMHELYASQ